ncbi:MAG TPA: sulfatase [Terriglobia bacterium]|nr:sulfatase [Terriglobia bacterium]
MDRTALNRQIGRRLWWLKEARQESQRYRYLAAKTLRTRQRPAADLPNVLVVSLDSVGAGHLGCYGYERPTSPHIDRLAQGGVLFENVRTQANWTKPALASLHTSLYPSVHRTDSEGETGDRVDASARLKANVLDARFRTAAQDFHDAGYATAGISDGGYSHSFFGFARGFDYYENRGGKFKSSAYRLLRWVLGQPRRPFFAWIHAWDAHFPYMDRPPYNRMFVDQRSNLVLSAGTRRAINGGHLQIGKSDQEFLKGLFDGAINYLDKQVGALLRELEQLDLLANTFVVITADHGEAFLEHAFVEHTECLYDEVLRVPMIVSGPGLGGGKRIRAQARSLDIMPTLLDLCGLSSGAEVQGVSLLPWIHGVRSDDLLAVSETERGGGQIALCDGRFKLIVGKSDDRMEIYDLESDPGEKQNLADRRPDLRGIMKGQLASWESQTRACAQRFGQEALEQSVELNAEVVGRLTDLGYLE